MGPSRSLRVHQYEPRLATSSGTLKLVCRSRLRQAAFGNRHPSPEPGVLPSATARRHPRHWCTRWFAGQLLEVIPGTDLRFAKDSSDRIKPASSARARGPATSDRPDPVACRNASRESLLAPGASPQRPASHEAKFLQRSA